MLLVLLYLAASWSDLACVPNHSFTQRRSVVSQHLGGAMLCSSMSSCMCVAVKGGMGVRMGMMNLKNKTVNICEGKHASVI